MSDQNRQPPRPAPVPPPTRPTPNHDNGRTNDKSGPNTISESRPVPPPPRKG